MNSLPQSGLWGSDAFGHVLRMAMPLLLWGLMMFMGSRAVRHGFKLFTRQVTPETKAQEVEALEQIPNGPQMDPAGRAIPFAGFDVAMYGSGSQEDNPATDAADPVLVEDDQIVAETQPLTQ